MVEVVRAGWCPVLGEPRPSGVRCHCHGPAGGLGRGEEAACPLRGLLGTAHAGPGLACGHRSRENAHLRGGGICGKHSPAYTPTPAWRAALFRAAQSPAPSLPLAGSWAPKHRPDHVAAILWKVQLWREGGRHSQPGLRTRSPRGALGLTVDLCLEPQDLGPGTSVAHCALGWSRSGLSTCTALGPP